VVVLVTLQTFNYFVKSVIEVNQIAVIVKYTTKKLELIVVKETQNQRQRKKDRLLHNVQEKLKMGQDVKTKHPMLMVDVMFTNNFIY